MAQDILDELLQTEKEAAELVAQAENDAMRKTRGSEQKIQKLQNEWKEELKQKRLAFQNDLEAGYSKEAGQAQEKTEAKLEKLKVNKTTLSAAADHLIQKILA